MSLISDYFVICSASSSVRAKTIADEIKKELKGAGDGNQVRHMEGYPEGRWILLDVSDVVVHIFDPILRAFYDLEHLWGDTPRRSVF